jgi:hypothetical protein
MSPASSASCSSVGPTSSTHGCGQRSAAVHARGRAQGSGDIYGGNPRGGICITPWLGWGALLGCLGELCLGKPNRAWRRRLRLACGGGGAGLHAAALLELVLGLHRLHHLAHQYDAFGVFGTIFTEFDWKTPVFSWSAVPKTPNASCRITVPRCCFTRGGRRAPASRACARTWRGTCGWA